MEANRVLRRKPNTEPTGSLIVIDHLPEVFSYRAGHITANVCGRLSSMARAARYRINDGAWEPIRQAPPRVNPPFFCVELIPEMLLAGPNTVTFEVSSGRSSAVVSKRFIYNPAPVRPPFHIVWDGAGHLDVEGGVWETFETPTGRRLRPKPGFEDYDRLIIVSGAFPGGRRVTTDVVFRKPSTDSRQFGFGVLPLWGGRPDQPGHCPRRGWNFSLGWYYSHYRAVGMEFSYKHGGDDPRWVATYRDLALRSDKPYTIIVEAREVVGDDGNHLRYHQRMQWREDAHEPTPWMELADDQGAKIPAGEFGVALIAHRCQVDFGPVSIEPLDV